MKFKIIERTISQLKGAEKPREYRDAELRGFYVRVEPSGRGAYYYEHCFPSGQRQKKRLGEIGVMKASDARDLALKAKVECAERSNPNVKSKFPKITLREFLSGHCDDYAKGNLKTGLGYTNAIRRAFPAFMNLHLDEINVYEVDRWKGSYLKGRKPNTVNRAIAYLKAMMNKAVEWNLIAANPMRDAKLMKLDKKHRVRWLTDAEEKLLMEALLARESAIRQKRASANEWREARGYELMTSLEEGFADHLLPMVLLSMNTGMRQGELFNLRWRSVDFDRMRITVEGAYSKTFQTRLIPMNQMVFATLKRWAEQNPENAIRDELVFASPRTGNAIRDVKVGWSKVLKTTGIQDFRWHDMRHHFASKLSMKGVSLQIIREVLGHSGIEMTLRYAHLDQRTVAEAIGKISIGFQSW